MARYVGAGAAEPVWIEASPKAPCSLCGAKSGCTAMADGQFVRCRLEVSQWPLAGGGWLHRVTEREVALAQ